MSTDIYIDASMTVPTRKRDAGRTRGDIIAAAQHVFSTMPYAAAGVGRIAARAGINQSLINRYFGSKAQLYAAALTDLLRRQDEHRWREDTAIGDVIVRSLIGGGDGPRDPLPMVIHGSADAEVRAVAHDVMVREIFRPLAAWLGPPDADARAAEVLSLCAGLHMYRTVLPLPPFEGAMAASARTWLERSIQAIVDRSDRLPPMEK